MCGIAGGLWRDETDASTTIDLALNAMYHRGPDSSGRNLFDFGDIILGLAQTRLSILDLSSAGHQPMHSKDGRWVIVFNGEIYNYREIRSQLQLLGYSFSSQSDTEVLLAAWIQWGVDCLPKLAGMFAFVVLDKQTRSLCCVRDAFGVKPFFYSNSSKGFKFASEMQAILALMPFSPPLNMQRVYDYLVHGDYDSGADTFYEGIHHLPPAHWFRVDLTSGIADPPHPWWTPSSAEMPGWRFDDAVDQLREQFLHNIRLHLRSDVPIGAALSGGIDSSAVVCAMRYLEPTMPIHTFSYIAKDDSANEEHWIDRVNAYVGAISHKISVTAADLVRDLDDMICAQGEPFGGTSIYAQYRVYQLAKEAGVTATLDGQGADEMLGGYIGYPGQRLRSLLETGKFRSAFSFWNSWSKWPGRSRLLAAKYLGSELTSGSLNACLRRLDGKSNTPNWINLRVLREQGVVLKRQSHRPKPGHRGRRVIDELSLSLTQRGLSSLLRHGDRNSMRFSVESRVPFLTLDMVNLLLSMPEEFLVSSSGQTKSVFRSAMRGIVPEDILLRKDKIGFATPRRLIPFNALSDLIVLYKNMYPREQEFLDFESVARVFSEEASNEYSDRRKWRLINFLRWRVLFGS